MLDIFRNYKVVTATTQTIRYYMIYQADPAGSRTCAACNKKQHLCQVSTLEL